MPVICVPSSLGGVAEEVEGEPMVDTRALCEKPNSGIPFLFVIISII